MSYNANLPPTDRLSLSGQYAGDGNRHISLNIWPLAPRFHNRANEVEPKTIVAESAVTKG